MPTSDADRVARRLDAEGRLGRMPVTHDRDGWEDRVVKLRLRVRDLEAEDLGDLDWSGGPEHVQAVAEVMQAVWEGDVESVVIALPNGRLVAHGAVDFRKSPDHGEIWMLSVHETLQSLGLGTRLIAALEAHVLARGLSRARLSVEHDNPRAVRLYRRLGYAASGPSVVQSWAVGGGRTYVTVCTVMERRLDTVPGPEPAVEAV